MDKTPDVTPDMAAAIRKLKESIHWSGAHGPDGLSKEEAALLDRILNNAALSQPESFWEEILRHNQEAMDALPEGVCRRCRGAGNVLVGPGTYNDCPECVND